MKLDKNYKVRVTPEQSREIQELVFGLGGKWNGGTDWVINEIIPFLYVTSGLVMTCDSKAQEYFGYASSENTEILATELIAKLEQLTKNDKTMNIDDFLKCKKVKCVDNDNTANCLTIGNSYRVVGVEWDGTVKIMDDQGLAQWYEMRRFEPAIESEESLVQDMELTPDFETEASETRLKVGNKVYRYGETDVKTVLEVFEDGYMRISNYPHRVNHEVLCHATPENHAVLSKPFPAIKFEQPPKELAGSDLAKALIEKGWVGFNCLCGHSGDENAITDTIVTGINEGGQFTTIDGRLFSNAIPMKGWRPLKAQEVSL